MNTDKISSSYEDLVKEGKELFENKQYKEAIKVKTWFRHVSFYVYKAGKFLL